MSWPCFWVEESGEVELSLRRYQLGDDGECPEGGFHAASSGPVGRRRLRRAGDGSLPVANRRGFGRRHPQWPKTCAACGHAFLPADPWQIDQEVIYRNPLTGEEWPLRRLPVGAMFDAVWAPGGWRNETDGMALTVVLPPEPDVDSRGHFWNVDGPATGGGTLKFGAWSRTGDPRANPPTVAASPSILTPTYHGFLQCGPAGSFLTDPC